MNTFDLVNCGPRSRYVIADLITHNSDDYGSGVDKKWRTLRLQGIRFTKPQMYAIQESLDAAFIGKKQFGEKLKREWELNKGFILDALGMPIAINRDKIKDSTNRCIQRSGHLILQIFLYKVTIELWRQGINYDWLIADFHDETMPLVDINQIEQMKAIYKDALSWLNKDVLQSEIPLKAVPQVAASLAEIKVEDFHEMDADIAELLEELND